MEIVNGFPCKNCTDVDYAKKHIDPAHPKDGPYGVNNPEKLAEAKRETAIRFGGSLQDPGDPARRKDPARDAAQLPPSSIGGLVDLRA